MSAFSPHNPKLQTSWDSTSLGALMQCPRYYQYAHLEGWQGDNVDLKFGIFAASAFEAFQKARLDGLSRDEATAVALRNVMEASEGWGGHYENQWRCMGVTKYKNNKGNAAKCPYSHKGAFFPEPSPGTCGECGSPCEDHRNYVPETPAKNRHTLVRLVVWYCLDQPEVMEDGLYPYRFPDGTAAVELSFSIPLPLETDRGEPYNLCGHMDYIGVFGEELFITDNKTTTMALGTAFFEGYSPNVQFDTYDLVGSLMFPDLPLKGVLLDGCQTMVGGARFGRHPYYRNDRQREEHLTDILFWIKQAEQFANEDYWPMNKKACWKCPFKQICSMDPGVREQFLKSNFHKREPWDPTIPR